jgi:hypothetical protein
LSDEPRTLQLPKELIVAVPLIGTAIAITFDVGYFSAIDINLFTLFSLSEHVVFSLEAMPLALIASMLVVAQIPTTHFSDKFLLPFLNKIPPKSWKGRLVRGLMDLFLIGTASYWFHLAYKSGIVWLIAATSLLLFYVVIIFVAKPLAKSSFFIVPYVMVAIFIITFFIGWDTAKSYLAENEILHVLTLSANRELAGKLIRSGDKGVMFATADKAILFIKWDDIVRIDSQYRAVMDKVLRHN